MIDRILGQIVRRPPASSANPVRDSVVEVEMISELLALFLPEEMQLLYRQRRCGRHRHIMSYFSWHLSS
jgi:hypothetical protein